MGFAITSTSCKKEQFYENQTDINKDMSEWTLEERVSYITEHFKKIGAIINQLWKNEKVKNYVIDKLNKN